MTDVKVAGEGWELSIFQRKDRSYYLSIPVDSGFVSGGFHFDLSADQANKLISNESLRKHLERELHPKLQGRLTAGITSATDDEALALIKQIVE